MSNIPRTPPHENRSNMSAEQDDQDIELIEHQQFNRGAGLQTYESNVPLNIDQEERMGRQLFSTVMVLSSQMTLLVSDMAVMKETMQQQQSMLDSTIQLGNQTVPLIFGNATPINRPTTIRPTMFSPSSPTTTAGGAPPIVPTPTISSTSVAILKYAKTTQISTDLVTKHSLSASDKNCDNLVHLEEALKASDVLALANGSRPLPVPTPTNPSGYSPTIVMPATFDGKPMYIVINEDDIFRYNAENKICMLLIQRILNKDMLHHLQPSIDANNASHTYLKILDFFKGHKHHHIESARVALNNFRFATDVEKNIFTLKDYISNLEKAQGSPLVDSNKFGVLRESMRVEKRVKINMAFDHACLTNQSFNETLDSILKVWNYITTNIVSNRMAAVTIDGEEKICFRFNQGLCKNKNCKYIHKIMSEQQKKDAGYDKDRKDSNKKTKINNKNK